MNWYVLGIEPTKDKKEITRAYRARLVHVNPEDKPQEFQELRAAYEEALALADQEEKPQEEKTPVELWVDQLEALYQDFPRRIDPEAWKELLAEDVCAGLDTRPLVEEALLRFLMEKYSIPQSVSALLEEYFDFSGHLEELYEHYPRDFVDYVVIGGSRNRELLRYDLFYPGRDGAACDRYVELFRKLGQTGGEERTEVVREMESMKEQHPYGQAAILRHYIREEDAGRLRDLELLPMMYPEDTYLELEVADTYIELQQKLEEAEQICIRAAAREAEEGADATGKHSSGYVRACWMRAQILACLEHYKEACDILNDMYVDVAGDPRQEHRVNEVRQEWNEKLIDQYQQAIQNGTADNQTRYELAWAYLQNQRVEEAEKVAEGLDPTNMEEFGYYNMMSIIHVDRKNWEGALEAVNQLVRIIPALKEDGTERTRKCMKRLPEMLHRKAQILMELKREEEAMEVFQEALELAPNDMELLSNLSLRCILMHKYETALNYANRMIQLREDSGFPWYLRAYALFYLEQDGAAFEAVNRSMDLDASELSTYVLKMRILIRNHVMDQAESILDMLKENELGEVPDVRFCEALLLDGKAETPEDRQQVEDMYRKLAEEMKPVESEIPWISELYYHMAVLSTSKDDIDGAALLEIIDRSLALDPLNDEAKLFKAWVLKTEKRWEEAAEIYLDLEQRIPDHYAVLSSLGAYYYRSLEVNAPKAREYYERALELRETGDDHFYAGMACKCMGDFPAAEAHFRREQELDPEDVDGFFRMSRLYQMTNRIPEAVEQSRKALELAMKFAPEHQVQYYREQIRALRRMDRYDDALDICRRMIQNELADRGYEEAVEALMAAGRFPEISQWMKEWKKTLSREYRSTYQDLYLHTLLCTGKTEKVRLELLRLSAQLSPDQLRVIRRSLFLRGGKALDSVKLLKEEQERMKKEEDTGSLQQITVELAVDLWKANRREEARQVAEGVKDDVLASLGRESRYRPIYLGRLAVLEAILGNPEQGREWIREMRKLPACVHCQCKGCKDAHIWESCLEEIAGNVDRSMIIAQEGVDLWPDELDFQDQIEYLKKVMKKRG